MLDTHGRKFVEPIIGTTADVLARFGLTPTGVTYLAGAMGVLSGCGVAFGQPLIGVLLLWMSGFADAVDGAMARKLGQKSDWGALCDVFLDRVVEISVIVACISLSPEYAFQGMLLLAAIVLSMTVFLTVGALSEKASNKAFYYQAGLAERTEGFLFLTGMILLPKWTFFITLAFTAAILWTVGQRLVEARRFLK